MDQAGHGPAALPFAFALGLASALASACCTLPYLALLIGYAGTQAVPNRRRSCLEAVFFMVASLLSLVAMGAVAAFMGQVAQAGLGRYWKVLAGLLAIAMGLIALRLVPFHMPGPNRVGRPHPHGYLGIAGFGLVAGGGISAASLGCNPGIFILLGVAALQGQALWAMLLMTAYALGFSLPLAALLLGFSLGASSLKARRTEGILRWIGGVLLLPAGFYFLATV